MLSATQKTTTEAIKGSIVKTTFVELKKNIQMRDKQVNV